MKTVYQIAKENNMSVATLYKRVKSRKMSYVLEKGIMMFNPEQEKDILVYSKRGRKNAQNKKTSDQKSIR